MAYIGHNCKVNSILWQNAMGEQFLIEKGKHARGIKEWCISLSPLHVNTCVNGYRMYSQLLLWEVLQTILVYEPFSLLSHLLNGFPM